MRYRAAFFDRDGTLTHGNPEVLRWRDETIRSWSGKPFELPYEKMAALMEHTGQGRRPWYRNVEEEKVFWLEYHRQLLIGEDIAQDLDARASLLFRELWCEANPPIPYPETVDVLEYFQSRGYRMGVISDTSPSLELTLKCAGIAKYFTSFTASSLVGAGKPDPIIYNAALRAQGVSAHESLYVDDYDVEADGARNLGFTAFCIDRGGSRYGRWRIHDLMEMVEYVEREGNADA